MPRLVTKNSGFRNCRRRDSVAMPGGVQAISLDGFLTVSSCHLYAPTLKILFMKIVREGVSATINIRLIGIRNAKAGGKDCGKPF